MTNKILLILIGIAILCVFLGVILINFTEDFEYYYVGWDLYEFGFWIGSLLGLALLVLNGTFIKTGYFKIAFAIAGFILIAAVLKILHWFSFPDVVIIAGLVVIMLLYVIHFVKKPTKQRLDYLKLFWVLTAYSLNIINYLHLIPNDYAQIGNYLLWLLVIDFAFTGLKNGTIFREEI